MGILYQDARMFLEARLRGASFENTLTVAHLSLHLHPSEVKRLRQAYHKYFPQSTIKPLQNYQFNDYSDDFFRDFLGVKALSVLDYSPYEGANIIHDLNLPVSENLWGQFDVVIDAGSLEHIFDFPTAIANLMKMLKVGGSIFITTPANNLCGHGFYQFSPELMFRVFTAENGFIIERVVFLEAEYPAVELAPFRSAYKVVDPAEIQSRVRLVSKRPVLMIVEAKKTDQVPIFARLPLQSDYVAQWAQGKTQFRYSGGGKVLQKIVSKLPFWCQTRIQGYHQKKRYSFNNTRFYKKLPR